ncbi:biliverdin-producing heme oxygenase, partial [Streptomyces sp. NPDC006324]|uniref:biliverdin-producing heme oxygenase n=1 Tax=Streptomyces sp. NPDC006324 TaxID=3156751 RepID=UPI0033A98F22
MDTPFSTLIRTASHEQHTEAETSSFMGDLLGGRLGVDAYARYTEQLWFVYRTLEEGAEALREDPVAGPFKPPPPGRAPGARTPPAGAESA